MSRYQRWVQLDDTGRVVKEKLTASRLPPPWTALSQAEADAMLHDMRAFRRAGGRWEKLPRIHLGGRRRFPADGESTGVLVLKRFPEGVEEVEVEVNGERMKLRERTGYEVGPTAEPGSWKVRVTDRRVVADPAEILIEAERPREV